MLKLQLESTLSILSLALLSACFLVKYQPIAGIDTVDLKRSYRFETSKLQHEDDGDTLIVVMFSGGETRVTAPSYGVLEQLNQQQITIGGKRKSLSTNIGIATGISSGLVSTAYFAPKGEDTTPLSYKRFLYRNF